MFLTGKEYYKSNHKCELKSRDKVFLTLIPFLLIVISAVMIIKNRVLIISLIIFSGYFLRESAAFAQPVTNIPVSVTEGTGTPAVGNQRGNTTRIPTRKASSRQDIVKRTANLSNRMLSRANDALLRLDNIWTRVKSRIDKFQASGKDVSGLSGWIQQVEFKRKAAADGIASASASTAKIESSATPKTSVKTFLNLYRDVKKALRDYHQAILAVITNLKGMSAQTGSGPSVIPQATNPPGTSPTTTIPTPTTIQATVTVGPT